MIWNASGGAANEVEALFLLALLLDVEVCPAASAINKQTVIRIQVWLPGDVDEERAKQEEGDPMDTEAEATG